MRLDRYLFEAGLTGSRSRAAALIEHGCVTVNGKPITKASFAVEDGFDVQITGDIHSYVGRGGLKLEAILRRCELDVTGKICADIGASTGGFTDCLLQHGAAHVYAVDAGHDQLDKKLREDPRVTSLEGLNARFLGGEQIPEPCGCAVMDLSFISQTLVLPALRGILAEGGILLTLIKPQFECGREAVGRGGIVKDPKQHAVAIRKVLAAAEENGFAPQRIIRSPITGGDGNTEFLLYAILGGKTAVTETHITEALHEQNE